MVQKVRAFEFLDEPAFKLVVQMLDTVKKLIHAGGDQGHEKSGHRAGPT